MIMEKYEQLVKLSKGPHGTLYKATDRETGELVILKKSRLPVDQSVPSRALREISILESLPESRYVARCTYVARAEKNGQRFLYLAFDYFDFDLSECKGLHWEWPLRSRLVQSFLYQLLKGVAHLHSNGVLHRDLKPRSLWIAAGPPTLLTLKIANLGLATASTVPRQNNAHDQLTTVRYYSAPEVLLGSPHYTPGADMWSVGCIFAEMVRMQALFSSNSVPDLLSEIFRFSKWGAVAGSDFFGRSATALPFPATGLVTVFSLVGAFWYRPRLEDVAT